MEKRWKSVAAKMAGRVAISCVVGPLGLALMPGGASAAVTYNASLVSPALPADNIPGVYFGSGNSNTNFTVDTSNGIELGLSAITRFIGPIVPTTTNVYNVPTGATTNAAGGSAWGVDFSIDLGPGGDSSGLTLADVTASVTLTDVGNHTSGSANPLDIPDNSQVGSGGVVHFPNEASTNWAAQNSEALSFPAIASLLGDSGYNVNANDTYDFTLSVTCANVTACGPIGTVLGTDTIVVVAGSGAPVPEPASLALLGFGLIGLGVSRRRRGPVSNCRTETT